MTRTLATLPFMLAALVLAPAAGAASHPRVPVTARLSLCHPAVDPFKRQVAYRATMLGIPGARRLAIADDLLVRRAGAPSFTSLRAPGLGSFQGRAISGGAAKDRFRRVNTVDNLAGPATYRFRITFRWYDRDGHVLKTVESRTKTCFQPEPRPDLRFVGAITTSSVPGHPRQTRYEATVKNAGGSPSGAFTTAFSFPGEPVRTKAAPSLRAGAATTVRFVGPPCTAGATPALTLDPDNSVREFDETNNALRGTCSVAPAP